MSAADDLEVRRAMSRLVDARREANGAESDLRQAQVKLSNALDDLETATDALLRLLEPEAVI